MQTVGVATAAFLLLRCPVVQAEEPGREGRIRAALVYSIMKFADSQKLLSESELVICLAGADETTAALPATVSGKLVRGKLVQTAPFESSNKCSVLFVAETKKTRDLLKTAHAAGILTICNTTAVEWDTCMIQLYQENNKARIAVDLPLLRSFGMKLHPDVLQLALVRPEG